MYNMKTEVKGNSLIITILDLNAKPGKVTDKGNGLIASSQGNILVRDDIKLGLNVFKPVKK